MAQSAYDATRSYLIYFRDRRNELLRSHEINSPSVNCSGS